jgi:hypothetical protein
MKKKKKTKMKIKKNGKIVVSPSALIPSAQGVSNAISTTSFV